MEIRTEIRTGAPAVIRVGGSFADAGGVEALRTALVQCVERCRNGVIIDLDAVLFLSSLPVGELVRAHVTMHRLGRPFVVCGLNERVYTILAVTKVNLVLPLAQSFEEAKRLASVRVP